MLIVRTHLTGFSVKMSICSYINQFKENSCIWWCFAWISSCRRMTQVSPPTASSPFRMYLIDHQHQLHQMKQDRERHRTGYFFLTMPHIFKFNMVHCFWLIPNTGILILFKNSKVYFRFRLRRISCSRYYTYLIFNCLSRPIIKYF